MHFTILCDEQGDYHAGRPQSKDKDSMSPTVRAQGEHPVPPQGRPQGYAPTILRMKWLGRTVYGRVIPLRSLSCLVFCLILTLLLTMTLSLNPGRASAFSVASTNSLTLQVDAGFGTYFRTGAWVPLYITVHNDGSDFSGMLATNNPAGIVWQDTYSVVPSSTYQQSVIVPHGTQKQVTLYLPITAQFDTVSISVQLLDNHGKVVKSQSVLLHQLFSGNVLVGLLSDQMTGFDSLRNVVLPNSNGSVQVQYLNEQTMPSMATVLANFNLIVLDTFHTSSLTHEQLRALYLWVQQGGTLIEVGGPHWQQTLSTLPANLLPVKVQGVSVLPTGAHLLPAGISTPASSGIPISDTLQVSVPVSSATVLERARTIVSAGDMPLLVQEQSQQGLIYYLAYDPTLEPIVHWPGATILWRGLIIRSLGVQLLSSNFQQGLGPSIPFYLAKLQHLLLSNPSPAPWLLLLFFLSYLLILGPIRWLIVRRTKRRQWSWRIILGAIFIFSLLNYAVAFYQERTSIFNNSISIIQLARGNSFAHSTTYHGVYAPFVSADSNVQVEFPTGTLVQPFVEADQKSGQASITAIPGGTQVKETDTTIRLVDAFQAEQDISIQGGIISHLMLGQDTLSGTVTNTLPTALSDVYLLMPHRILRIGNMAAGQISRVTLSLTAPSTNGSLSSCASLVKQVVNSDAGILTGYDHLFVHSVIQSLSERQRHLSLLAFMLTASQCNNSLLNAAGAPATLIGWADQPLAGENTVTVNGIQPGGLHETAVVAGLDIAFAAGSLTLPADVLSGRLVDAEALKADLLSSNAYTLTHGQITFEYSLPASQHFRIQTMTLSQPVDPSILPSKQPGGPHSSASHVVLYNWQTNSWDIIHLTQSTPFTTQHAQVYLSPDGRMLVQYANQASDFSDIAFTMPALTITGIAANS